MSDQSARWDPADGHDPPPSAGAAAARDEFLTFPRPIDDPDRQRKNDKPKRSG